MKVEFNCIFFILGREFLELFLKTAHFVLDPWLVEQVVQLIQIYLKKRDFNCVCKLWFILFFHLHPLINRFNYSRGQSTQRVIWVLNWTSTRKFPPFESKSLPRPRLTISENGPIVPYKIRMALRCKNGVFLKKGDLLTHQALFGYRKTDFPKNFIL